MDESLSKSLPHSEAVEYEPLDSSNVKAGKLSISTEIASSTQPTVAAGILGTSNDPTGQDNPTFLEARISGSSDDWNTGVQVRSRPLSSNLSSALLSSHSSVITTPQSSPTSTSHDGDILNEDPELGSQQVGIRPEIDPEASVPVSSIDTNMGSTITTDPSLTDNRQEQQSGFTYPSSEDPSSLGIDASSCETPRNRSLKRMTPPIIEKDGRGHRFQDRLLRTIKKVPGHAGGKGFFPQDTFAALVNEDAVAEELRRCNRSFDSETIQTVSRRVCGTQPLKRIFVLLVLTHKVPEIQSIIEDGVKDDDLPLCKVPYQGANIFQLARRSHTNKPEPPLRCFDSWDPLDIWNFEEWQWTMLAPYFSHGKHKKIRHLLFPDQMPLPFTLDSRYGAASQAIKGGFSTIFKVDIHPEHHSFRGPEVSGHSFAVKYLDSSDRVKFKKEVDMLMTFSGNVHPHLISLLATYEQFNRFYLIFPWADADLKGYWMDKNPNPTMDYDTIVWMAKQCHGIAEGLTKIHRHRTINLNRLPLEECQHISGSSDDWLPWSAGNNAPWQLQLFGRHGDIKPQNVLWFSDPQKKDDKGVLKITDLGLAEFSTSARHVYKANNKVTVSAQYRPPECDLKGGSVGQSQDIWALGCLYLELVAWLLGGRNLLEQFQKQRLTKGSTKCGDHPEDGTFFQILRDGQGDTPLAIVKPAVTTFINDLYIHPACTEYIHRFLSIVQEEMLIVKPPNSQEKGRMEIMELTRILKDLYERCSDSAFATMSWSQNRLE